ncbi:hypothetical protein [Peribacillus frigoritolerans]|uniref:hypothetical protein n=1 Tax=Peribacillus frigoritolerans TaxID=450367 RepID=UPI003F7FE109
MNNPYLSQAIKPLSRSLYLLASYSAMWLVFQFESTLKKDGFFLICVAVSA